MKDETHRARRVKRKSDGALGLVLYQDVETQKITCLMQSERNKVELMPVELWLWMGEYTEWPVTLNAPAT